MGDTFILAFEIISVMFVVFDFIYAYRAYQHTEDTGRFLGAAAFSAGVVVICYLFSIRPGTYRSASIAASLYFAGIDWMLVALTHFIFLYTGRKETKVSVWARRLIRVIATIDSVIMIINIFSEIAIHYVDSGVGVPPYVYEMKPLYVAHLLFTYALVLYIFYILIDKIRTTPRLYRNQYFLIIFAIGLVVVMNAFFLYPSNSHIWGRIDVSVLGYSLGLYFTYWAAFDYRFRYMPRALSMTIFENIGQGLALFDHEDELIMQNRQTERLIGKKLQARMPSADLTAQLQLPPPGEARDHYSIQCDNEAGQALRCDYSRLRDDRDGVIGNLYVFTDATNDVDILTGFQMWTGFRLKVAEEPELFVPPAVVMIFDITGLGEINRTFGRDAGDQRIRRLSRLIKDFLPTGAHLIRGYEANLVAVLPESRERDLLEMAEQIVEASGGSVLFGISELQKAGAILDTARVAARDLQVKKLLDPHSIHSQALSSLIKALQESDSETEAHVQRTQKMGEILGKRIGLTDAQLSDLKLLCLLHDIGKIGIPLEILNKPGRLSDDEWAVLRTHPAKGYQICMSTEELRPIAEMVLCHHERWDGNGYPEHLKGANIPILSRVIAIVDAYDAMVNDRPYRKALEVAKAQEEIRRCAGSQFDPDLAREFLAMLAEHPEVAEGERTGAREVGIFLQDVTGDGETGNTRPVRYSHYYLDIDERIEEVDEAFTELTGYTAAEAAAMTQFDLIPQENRQHYIVMVSNQFSKGNIVFLQHEIQKKDGSRICVLCMGKKYYDSAIKTFRSEIFITPVDAVE